MKELHTMIELEHDVINARTVSKMFHCNYATVLYLARHGKLPHFKVGHLYKFRRSQIENFVEKQLAESTAKSEHTEV